MSWFYADGGRQMGPVEESALDDLVRQGVVRDDTLVWREGMPTWQAHGSARPRPVAPPPPPPAPPPPQYNPAPQYSAPQAAAPAPALYTPPEPQYSAPQAVLPQAAPQPQYSAPPPASGPAGGPAPGVEMRYCAECGRGYPAYELSMVGAAAVCSSCRPAVMQRMGPAAYMPPPASALPMAGRRYAGFWIRFLARVIDGIILFAVSFVIRLPLGLLGLGGAALIPNLRDPSDVAAMIPALIAGLGISMMVNLVIGVLYETYFLSSRGATPGKMALGLKVIRADGGPLSAGLAAGRYFAQWLSSLTFLIGYIMAGFDSEKRSLHDRVCNTRVIYSK